jgi:ubiquinone/menaquinone biosynthesis C-methylase UbiE
VAWKIFEPVASKYETWYESDKGRRVGRAERTLLDWMLLRLTGTETVLEVGCGTGHFSRYLASRSLRVVGMDRSPAMLASLRKGNPQIAGIQADAHGLPFRDRAVDAVVFVTSLEFMDEPRDALSEAVRVSRRGVMLVVLNSRSLGGLSRRVGPQSSQPILGHAQDYSARSLRSVVRSAAGERLRVLQWRYGCYPRGLWTTPSRLPGGDVIAMVAVLTSSAAERRGGISDA